MDDAAREAAVAAALEHIRRSTAYSAVLRGYGSYEQYEDVAERLSEIRVSASMLPAAGAAAEGMGAIRAALRAVPVPPRPVEFAHWRGRRAGAASPAPPDEASHLSLDLPSDEVSHTAAARVRFE